VSFYPNKIDNFIEKLNKLESNTYVIEEIVTSINGNRIMIGTVDGGTF